MIASLFYLKIFRTTLVLFRNVLLISARKCNYMFKLQHGRGKYSTNQKAWGACIFIWHLIKYVLLQLIIVDVQLDEIIRIIAATIAQLVHIFYLSFISQQLIDYSSGLHEVMYGYFLIKILSSQNWHVFLSFELNEHEWVDTFCKNFVVLPTCINCCSYIIMIQTT